MSIAAIDDDRVRAWALKLEEAEKDRCDTIEDARKNVARQLRISVGSLETLRRGRMKKLGHALVARCQALIIRELKHEIQELNHELEIARQCGLPASSDEITEIEALLQKARSKFASMAARSG